MKDGMNGRQLPHNIAAEQALLGALLINNAALDRVDGIVGPDHFYDPLHAEIYDRISTLVSAGRTVTPLTIRTDFEHHETIGDLTVPQYLGRLAASATTVINAREYAVTVRDLGLRRSLIESATGAIDEAYAATVDSDGSEILETLERDLTSIAERGRAAPDYVDLYRAAGGAIDLAANAYQTGTGLAGLSTGFQVLDRKLGGLQASDLVIIAGRPSMGKALASDELVLLADGSTMPIEQLKIGDQLASIDSAASHVTGVFPQGEKRLFRVTFSDGRSTRACAEHIWRVHFRDWERARLLSTADLAAMLERKRYRNRLWIDVPAGDFGHSDPLPLDPWLLGVLIGDGSMGEEDNVRLSTPDAEILYRVQNALPPDDHLVYAGQYDYRIKRRRRSNRTSETKAALRGLDLLGCNSWQRFVPESYRRANMAARLDLLRGLIDTDGYVEKSKTVRFATSSEQLARDVQEIVRSVGGHCAIVERHPKFEHLGESRSGRLSYVDKIRHATPEILVQLFKKRRRLEARSRRAPRLNFSSIVADGSGPATCISVSHPSKLFLTGAHIASHNTALATNIAFQSAKGALEHQVENAPLPVDQRPRNTLSAPVAFFSLEMSADQLAMRILAEMTGISANRIRRGQIEREGFDRLMDARQTFERIPFHIDQSGRLSVHQVCARARRLKRQHDIGLVVVDYLQLLAGSRHNARQGRTAEVTEITGLLKALAKELGVPVVAISQLSRQVESRDNKRPTLADLRESGSIEQDADVVLFVYREAYYHARDQPEEHTGDHLEWSKRMDEIENKAEIIVSKQRHGPTGAIELRFDGSLTRFTDPDDNRPLPADVDDTMI